MSKCLLCLEGFRNALEYVLCEECWCNFQDDTWTVFNWKQIGICLKGLSDKEHAFKTRFLSYMKCFPYDYQKAIYVFPFIMMNDLPRETYRPMLHHMLNMFRMYYVITLMLCLKKTALRSCKDVICLCGKVFKRNIKSISFEANDYIITISYNKRGKIKARWR